MKTISSSSPPAAPLATVVRARRPWIRLPSGGRIDLMAPDPASWTDEDLAIRLSRTYRWSGESIWPQSLSVAQHSLLVMHVREANSPEPLAPNQLLRELLHDAEEGLMGFDCPSPLKAELGQPFAAVSERLMKAIEVRYSLPPWTPAEHRLHKVADITAAAAEAVHCVGWAESEIPILLGTDVPFLRNDPLVPFYGDEPWKPWSLEVAQGRFLNALRTLLHARDRQRECRPGDTAPSRENATVAVLADRLGVGLVIR